MLSSSDLTTSDQAIEDAKSGNLGQLLLRSARLFDGLARERLAKKHPAIRRSHLQLMPHLDLDGTGITELARRAEISKQAVNQLVDDMEDAGYLKRHPDPKDGRAKIVRLTRKGRKGMLDGLAIFSELAGEVRGKLGDTEMDALVAKLDQLLNALESAQK